MHVGERAHCVYSVPISIYFFAWIPGWVDHFLIVSFLLTFFPFFLSCLLLFGIARPLWSATTPEGGKGLPNVLKEKIWSAEESFLLGWKKKKKKKACVNDKTVVDHQKSQLVLQGGRPQKKKKKKMLQRHSFKGKMNQKRVLKC